MEKQVRIRSTQLSWGIQAWIENIINSKLYDQLADDLAQQIDEGIYLPGDKLPSIRKLSKQRRVSTSTVQNAYELLEKRQRVISRPQSGFYVREIPVTRPLSVVDDQGPNLPASFSIHQMATRVLQNCQRPGLINLGTALPSPEFLPVKQLQRLIAGLVRHRMSEIVVSEFPPGLQELRVQIARRMAELGCHVTADDIVITNGCQEALLLCLRAVAESGDIVAVESPCFIGTLQAIESLGMKVLEIPCDSERGISINALKLALEQWPVRAMVLNPTNNNPLGFTMTDVDRKVLLDVLTPRGIPIIEDNLFGDMQYSGSCPKALKAYDRHDQVLYCSSISKSIAPGLRVGWVSAGHYQPKIEFLKSFTSVGTSTLCQMAVAEFLENGGYDRHLRRIQSAYSLQMRQMIDAVERYFPPGTTTSKPKGGYILWVKLPEEVDAMLLHEKALAEGIAVMPGSLFSVSRRYENCIRLNCALPWSEQVKKALKTIGVLAGSLRQRGIHV
ncbi:GntR family transcriptional regulator [Marinobacterium nitratireducens]|uniref:GntR family transcriptional regulator n=1 Tax=Marinobacterium nitratireducens TaxID=518897 RepID=A0A918DTZ0_9GAMM|nr:GntR family transcriptional regulator [Marinobacterium nitratireducens]